VEEGGQTGRGGVGFQGGQDAEMNRSGLDAVLKGRGGERMKEQSSLRYPEQRMRRIRSQGERGRGGRGRRKEVGEGNVPVQCEPGRGADWDTQYEAVAEVSGGPGYWESKEGRRIREREMERRVG